MKQYINLLKDIVDNGTERDDRTKVGTISIFGRQIRFNLADGFPAITTKKLAWKAVVSELLWFLEGSTNEHRLAEIKSDNKPYNSLTYKEQETIWTLNAENQGVDLGYFGGNLGNVYGKQFTGLNKINYYVYEVVDNAVAENCIKLTDTSNVVIGGITSQEDTTQPLLPTVYKLWRNIIDECVSSDTLIDKRWLTYTSFLEDVCQITGYLEFAKRPTAYCIDLNEFGANAYSKSTCVFMPKIHSNRLKNAEPIAYKDSLYLNVDEFCESHKWADKNELLKHLNGEFNNEYKNISRVDIPQGKHFRYLLKSHNQIENVIEQIKNTPTSRRIMVNAWNVCELDTMALPPCHYGFQFYVDGDKLSLMWNQRSVDVFLGLPFNIASYALLLNIIAKMTNKIPYELIGNLGDTHIYKNHIDVVKEQLKRTPHNLPTLVMPDVDYQNISIDEVLKSVKTSDFKLENYIHDEPLKAPMAV